MSSRRIAFLHLHPVALAVLGAALMCACSQEIAGDIRDAALESRLLVAGKARKPVSAASLVNSPDTLLCVLRPYQADVRPKGSDVVSEINHQLLRAKYVAAEGHWAVVAYQQNKPIRVAVVQQGVLQMARAQKELCAPAAMLRLTYNSDGQIAFTKE